MKYIILLALFIGCSSYKADPINTWIYGEHRAAESPPPGRVYDTVVNTRCQVVNYGTPKTRTYKSRMVIEHNENTRWQDDPERKVVESSYFLGPWRPFRGNAEAFVDSVSRN